LCIKRFFYLLTYNAVQSNSKLLITFLIESLYTTFYDDLDGDDDDDDDIEPRETGSYAGI